MPDALESAPGASHHLVRRRLAFLATAAVAVLASGCDISLNSEKQGATDEVDHARHSLHQSDAKLGEGYTVAETTSPNSGSDGEATGKVCIETDPSHSLTDFEPNAFRFYVRSRGEVPSKIHSTTGPLYKSTATELTDHYDQYDFTSPDAQIFSLLVAVTTLEGKARPDDVRSEFSDGSICNGPTSKQPKGIREFVDTCGAIHLQSRTRGGYVLFTADVSDVSGEEKSVLDELVDDASNTASSSAPKFIFERLDQQSDLRFDVATTVPSWDPSHATTDGSESWPGWQKTGRPDLLNSNDRFDPARWPDYEYFLRKYDADDDRRDGFELHYSESTPSADGFDAGHPRYGDTVAMEFGLYEKEDIERCSFEDDAFDAYESYAGNVLQTRELLETGIRGLLGEKLRAEWKLNHPERVRWQRPVAETKSEYRRAVDHYKSCHQRTSSEVDTLREVRRACRRAFERGEFERLTSACRHTGADSCGYREIKKRFDGLPFAIVLNPAGAGPPRDGYPAYERPEVVTEQGNTGSTGASPETHVCALTRVQGDFADGDSNLRLFFANETRWDLRLKGGEGTVKGSIVCAKRRIFFDSGANEWLPMRNHKVSTDRGRSAVGLKEDRYVSAFAGLNGGMNRKSDQVDIDLYRTGKDILSVRTDEGELEAYANSFGMKAPARQPPRGYLTTAAVSTVAGTDGKQTKPLDFTSKEGICFLTRVTGEFDGLGESARVFRKDGRWYLQVTAGCRECSADNLDRCFESEKCEAYKTIEARARCYHFDQKR